jgi:two-component system NtrC family sensor kinase
MVAIRKIAPAKSHYAWALSTMNINLTSIKHVLTGLLMLISLSVSAQKKEWTHIDSLLTRLYAAREDTNRATLLIKLGRSYSNLKNTDSTDFYLQNALQLSEKLKWKKGIMGSYYYLGLYYYNLPDFVKAQNYLTKAIELSFDIKDYRFVYYAADRVAAAIVLQKKTPEQINYLVFIADRLKRNNQTELQADIYVLIGDYSQHFFNYDAAMEYFDKALKLEETDHRQYLTSYNLIEIAYFYMSIHNPKKAMVLLLKAVAMDEKTGDLPALADAYTGLAHCADDEHDEAAVITYYDKALQTARKTKDNNLLCRTENEISWNYFVKKDYDQAYTHARSAILYIKAIPVNLRTLNDLDILAYALGTMGSIYREAPDAVIAKAGLKPGQQYEKSVALLVEGINLGKKHMDFDLVGDNTRELSLTYEKMHRYADAFKTYKTYITQRDSTDSLKNEKAIALKEAQLSYTHKADSLNYRQNITSTQLKQQKLQSYFFIGGIAALLVLSLFIGLNYYNQRKSNKLLAEANNQVTNANHELSEQREEITSQRDRLVETVSNLKTAQQQLVQSEKMASLGELTAGIAHEIQNPLNFVNNFSEVNREMIDELKAELRKGDIKEALTIADDIQQNEEKILHHGKRADGIVKGMLEHSRTSTGQKEPTDLNKLADEYLRLAYHGLRAKDKSFNAELITHFAEKLPQAAISPQDIGRVLLNLYNNAFYAVQQKGKFAEDDYKPQVTVTTSTEKGNLLISVKDNGNGIPDAIKEKIMQPFFTTKPTGQGTGLGLSLSYDIVVKGHGGSVAVNSAAGEGAEFIIQIPLT